MNNTEELTLKGYFAVFECELHLYGVVRTFDTLEEVRNATSAWLDMCVGYPMRGSVTAFDSLTLQRVDY